jgi:hypothetical protein
MSITSPFNPSRAARWRGLGRTSDPRVARAIPLFRLRRSGHLTLRFYPLSFLEAVLRAVRQRGAGTESFRDRFIIRRQTGTLVLSRDGMVAQMSIRQPEVTMPLLMQVL